MANFGDYPGDFRLFIWRLGETVQNLESLGLPGRVDSPGEVSHLKGGHVGLWYCSIELFSSSILVILISMCDIAV